MRSLAVVTVPPTSTAFTLIANARVEIGLSPTDTSQDVALARFIAQATGLITDYLGWPVGIQTIRETIRNQSIYNPFGLPSGVFGPGQFYYRRDPAPLAAAYAYIAAGATVTEFAGSTGVLLVENTDYEADWRSGLIWRLSGGSARAPWTAPTVVLTYQSGFALPGAATVTMPPVLEQACLSLIRSGYAALGQDSRVLLDLSTDLGRVQYSATGAAGMSLDDSITSLIAPYRRDV